MSWIKTIAYEKAKHPLKKIYDRVSGPNGSLDNVLLIHGLRPHTLKAHMGLYKSVLHHSDNKLPVWYLEALGVYVSHLNACSYCVDHHLAGIERLLSLMKANRMMKALAGERLETFFNKKEISGLHYSRVLTLSPGQLTERDLIPMRKSGFDDGEILEINQVVSYFNYVNRTVLGLGVTTEGDVLGLSPRESSDPGDWGHQ